MKKQVLVLAIGLGLAPLAWAEAPQQKTDGAPAEQATEQAQAEPLNQRHCLRHTGSRIQASRTERQRRSGQKPGKNDCAMVAGRAYNRDDIERTGAFDLRDALRRLDPAFF